MQVYTMMSPRQRREVVAKAMSPSNNAAGRYMHSTEKQKYMAQHLTKMQKLQTGIIRQKKKETTMQSQYNNSKKEKKKLQHKVGRNSALGSNQAFDAKRDSSGLNKKVET